ncbi:murein transglycosylase A [Aquabacter cavernae]|uniref:murein transglycosylase A n=1 Tax=Aquabacter cavernae TaxID=2496029 RepID=UPI000F8DA24C|nr:MltA domain-containing protein [Aquabacter cavernae]
MSHWLRALVLLLAACGPAAADTGRVRPVPTPAIPGAALQPLAFPAVAGWVQDDAPAAFATFRASCGALAVTPKEVGPASNTTLVPGLRTACAAARAVSGALGGHAPSQQVARLFFEANFRAYRIVPEANPPGFLTGYYEPEVDGSPVRTARFTVPIYGRPADLIALRPPADGNRGQVMRKEGDVLVPYYDRAAIEDGALAGKGLEVAWIEHPVDLFFMQIQGSARIRLADGGVLRLNYDGHNGYSYLPVGRLLIQRGLVPREDMSMDRIRRYIEADPAAGRALMRENRSFVFFKAVPLSGTDGALGAQGVPLTPGRSIAVDRALHAYGTPVFIEAELPLEGDSDRAPFRRLMIAQDTGSAIVGPARADLFFGAGTGPGLVAGRIRHPGTFTLLVPRFESRAP